MGVQQEIHSMYSFMSSSGSSKSGAMSIIIPSLTLDENATLHIE
jgi:hypothetical protein